MDKKVFKAWLSEPRAIKPLPNAGRRISFVDNCSGHAVDEEFESFLSKNKTIFIFLPPNGTCLEQPADSFIIQKIMDF